MNPEIFLKKVNDFHAEGGKSVKDPIKPVPKPGPNPYTSA